MKLEDMVCSLDLAKRLKELGVNQLSFFNWFSIHNSQSFELDYNSYYHRMDELLPDEYISAFTVAELGAMLPSQTRIRTEFFKNILENKLSGVSISFNEQVSLSPTEADARAYMVIYLIEKKLMEIPK